MRKKRYIIRTRSFRGFAFGSQADAVKFLALLAKAQSVTRDFSGGDYWHEDDADDVTMCVAPVEPRRRPEVVEPDEVIRAEPPGLPAPLRGLPSPKEST